MPMMMPTMSADTKSCGITASVHGIKGYPGEEESRAIHGTTSWQPPFKFLLTGNATAWWLYYQKNRVVVFVGGSVLYVVLYTCMCVCIPMCIHILSRDGVWSGVCVRVHARMWFWCQSCCIQVNIKCKELPQRLSISFVQQSLPVQTLYTWV